MKRQIFYIHGGDSFSKYEDFLNDLRGKVIRDLPGCELSNFWTKTLREDFGEEFEVFMPAMPNKQNAKYEEWKIWFERHFEFLRDDVVLIGWSLGGMFLAKYLSENNVSFSIKALYLLGAPSGDFGDEAGNDCGSFHYEMIKLENLSRQIEKINVWHSKDDFVVDYRHLLFYTKYLKNAKFISFDDKNHFLLPTFPELINDVKNNYK